MSTEKSRLLTPTATPRRVLSRRHVSGTLPRALILLLAGVTLCATATAQSRRILSAELLKEPGFETEESSTAWVALGNGFNLVRSRGDAESGFYELDVRNRTRFWHGPKQDVTEELNAVIEEYGLTGGPIQLDIEALVSFDGPVADVRVQLETVQTQGGPKQWAIADQGYLDGDGPLRVHGTPLINNVTGPLHSAVFRISTTSSTASNPDFTVDLCSLRVDLTGKISTEIAFREEMPVPMAFRASDGTHTPDPNPADFADFEVVHDNAPISTTLAALKDLKEHDTHHVTVFHAEAAAVWHTGPFPMATNLWPGHLLYYAGALVTGSGRNGSILKKDTTLTPVGSDIAWRRFARADTDQNWTMHAALYSLDKQGDPDWSQVEFVTILIANMDEGTLTIERGLKPAYPALGFKSSEGVVLAPIVPWCCNLENWWSLNFSPSSPLDADGLTAAQWAANEYSDWLTNSGLDGIQFDVGYWHQNREKRDSGGELFRHVVDADNDLIPDYGYDDGLNQWGLGNSHFFSELRSNLGHNKLIQIDAWDPSRNGARLPKGVVNGVEYESFGKEYGGEGRLSESILHMMRWQERGAPPAFSYAFTKEPTLQWTPSEASSNSQFRLGVAMSALLGTPHPHSEGDGGFGLFWWDEYQEGLAQNRSGWLGRPLGPPRQILNHLSTSSDLLKKANWSLVAYNGAESNRIGEELRVTDVGFIPENMSIRRWPLNVRYEAQSFTQLQHGVEYTVTFEAKGAYPASANLGDAYVPRLLVLNQFGSSINRSVLLDDEWRRYTISFTADSNHTFSPSFGIAEQEGSTWIRNIQMFEGGADRWLRWFENGLVVLNGTDSPWTLDFTGTLPALSRINGTQDPVNNGAAVGVLTVPAKDAVLLRR